MINSTFFFKFYGMMNWRIISNLTIKHGYFQIDRWPSPPRPIITSSKSVTSCLRLKTTPAVPTAARPHLEAEITATTIAKTTATTKITVTIQFTNVLDWLQLARSKWSTQCSLEATNPHHKASKTIRTIRSPYILLNVHREEVNSCSLVRASSTRYLPSSESEQGPHRLMSSTRQKGNSIPFRIHNDTFQPTHQRHR